jgi:hypothetical protein
LSTCQRAKEPLNFGPEVQVVNGKHLHAIGFLRPVVIFLLCRATLGGHSTEYRAESEAQSSSVAESVGRERLRLGTPFAKSPVGLRGFGAFGAR